MDNMVPYINIVVPILKNNKPGNPLEAPLEALNCHWKWWPEIYPIQPLHGRENLSWNRMVLEYPEAGIKHSKHSNLPQKIWKIYGKNMDNIYIYGKHMENISQKINFEWESLFSTGRICQQIHVSFYAWVFVHGRRDTLEVLQRLPWSGGRDPWFFHQWNIALYKNNHNSNSNNM